MYCFLVYYVLICFILNTINAIASVIIVYIHHATDDNKPELNLRYLRQFSPLRMSIGKQKTALDLRIEEANVTRDTAIKEMSNLSSLVAARKSDTLENLLAVYIHQQKEQLKSDNLERDNRERLTKFSATLDRLLLWVFLAITILVTLTMLTVLVY